MGSQVQMLGLYLAGVLSLVLSVLKLTIEGHWSWWRALLPLWVAAGHNLLYIVIGFVWLSITDDGEAGENITISEQGGAYAYTWAAMLCFLVFADNLLGRIEGGFPAPRLWLRSGAWSLISASLVLSIVCHLVFWSKIVCPGYHKTEGN